MPLEAAGELGFGVIGIAGELGLSIPLKGPSICYEREYTDAWGNVNRTTEKTSYTIFPFKFAAGLKYSPPASNLQGNISLDIYMISAKEKTTTQQTQNGSVTETKTSTSSNSDAHFLMHGGLCYEVTSSVKIGGELYIGDGVLAVSPHILYALNPSLSLEIRGGAPIYGTMGLYKEVLGVIDPEGSGAAGGGINVSLHYNY